MKTLFAGICAAALVIGVGFAPMLAYAEDATTGGAAEGGTEPAGDSKDETMMEKLEDALKETTTPTDEETNPIGTTEDADRDLY